MTAHETDRKASMQSRTMIAGVLTALIAALFLSVTTASAATVTDRPLIDAIDGSDSTIGGFDELSAVAVDYATGDVYALNAAGEGKGPGPFDADRVLCKFDVDGNAKNFMAGSSAGKSCLDGTDTPGKAFGVEGFFSEGPGLGVAVDNSGGSTQGRIYVMEGVGPVHAFAPTGTYLWTLTVPDPRGIAVGPAGHLWISNTGEVRKYANTGSPPAQIDSIPITSGNKTPAKIGIDDSGTDLYVALSPNLSPTSGLRGLHRYDTGIKAFKAVLNSSPTRAIAVDQSGPTGHLFALEGSGFASSTPFSEFDAAGAKVATFGGDLVGKGRGIAYNPDLDRVYVSDEASGSVKVFGPTTTDTAPDVQIGEADEIGRNAATLRGTVNPQGVPNDYRFETISAESQRVAVDATGGSFTLLAPLVLDPDAPPRKFQALSVSAEDGAFRLVLTMAEASGVLTQGSNLVTNLSLISGFFTVGDALYGGEGALFGGATVAAVNPGAKTLTLSTSAPQSAVNQLLVAKETTAPLPLDASVAEIKSALEALPGIAPGDVSVAETASGRWNVEFLGAFVEVEAPEIDIDSTELTGESIATSAIAGQRSVPIPSGASPVIVESTVESLAVVGAGNVSASGFPADGAGAPGRYDLAFKGALAGRNIEQLTAEGEGLSGGGKSATLTTLANGESWGAAEPSPPACLSPAPPLPEDSADHQVSCELSGLSADTAYLVRLVGENTASQLESYSTSALFRTLAPPTPTIQSVQISMITTESAHIEATVDPAKDKAVWRVSSARLADATKADCEALPASSFKKAAEGTIPAEEAGTVPIEADVTGLDPGQRICVRISATNNNGVGTANEVFQTSPVPPAGLETAFAAPRLDISARINGRVVPEGDVDFTYRFELSEDGSNWTPLPIRESSENGDEAILVAEELTGLKPGTTYHYRFAFAENESGPATEAGEEKTFTTRTSAEVSSPSPCTNEAVRQAQRSTYLPSCRAIELVNSPQKGTQHAFAAVFPTAAPPISPDGNKALWSVFSGAPGANSGARATFLAQRDESTPQGWSSKSLIPAAAGQIGGGRFAYRLQAATPELSRFIFAVARSDADLYGETTIARLGVDGSQESLETQPSPNSFDNPAMSEDGDHLLSVIGETGQLEDLGVAPHELVSVMPDGEPSECGLLGDGDLFNNRYDQSRLSTDASRVYFDANANGDCDGVLGLYGRNRETEETTLIDPGAQKKSPTFFRSSPDGRSAYFGTFGNHETYVGLDPEEEDQNEHGDIYRWDEESGTSTCLTCVVADASLALRGAGTDTFTRAMVSDDGSHVYFESYRQLIPGQGRAGDANLYVLSEGELRFVADTDDKEGLLGSPRPGSEQPDHALLSRDGNVLVFADRRHDERSLTVDDVAAECPTPSTADGPLESCQQVYRYDDRDGGLECISCRRGGPTTHSSGRGPSIEAGRNGMSLSADGSTVAFAVTEALVSKDVNDAVDIYVWRHGVVGLITDGVSDRSNSLNGVKVAAVSDDGRDVFFWTIAPGLTGFEKDGLSNLYDARIGGGFLPPASEPSCVGDACQGSLQAPPARTSPSSAGFNGRGNVKEKVQRKPRRSCAKKRGQAKRRCVRKQRKPGKHKGKVGGETRRSK